MKKIFFRADADKKIGYGHFIRTLALAEMLKDDFDCTFFTQEPTAFQQAEVRKVCKLIDLPADDSKFDIFLSYLTGDEIVFLDNYFFTVAYQKKIKDRGCKLVCLGTNDRHYYSDVLFNFAENDKTIFSVEPYTQIKLGIDWVILREPFRAVTTSLENYSRDNSIVICFGGTDQYCLTEKCIDAIRTIEPNSTIVIVATDSFGMKRINNLEKDGIKCYVNAEAEQVATILAKSKCVISSASTIACEALACGATVLCGYYIDNQIRMYNYLTRENLVLGLLNLNEPDAFVRLENCLINLHDRAHKLNKKNFVDLSARYISLFKSL